MKRIAVCMMIAALAGCAGRPNVEQLSQFDYGPNPIERTKVEEIVRASLIDPYSAHIQILSEFRGARGNGFGWEYGWGCIIIVNAKNRFGGYVGNKGWTYFVTTEGKEYFDTTAWGNLLNEYGKSPWKGL